MRMYVYLYDNMLRRKQYDALIKTMETRLTDYSIAGKIIRLQHFTNPERIIEEEKKMGASTVVIVGDNATFGHVLSRAAGSDVLFGFLPIGPDNSVAQVLGIPVGIEACDVLAQRRKVSLDVGWFNNRYFVSQLHIPPSDITVEYDEKFRVSSRQGRIELVVCNLQPFVWKETKRTREVVVHPQDGKLEAFLRPMEKKTWFRTQYDEPSIFPFEEMVVTGAVAFPVEADGRVTKEKRITIRLAKNRISMIVGKQRKF